MSSNILLDTTPERVGDPASIYADFGSGLCEEYREWSDGYPGVVVDDPPEESSNHHTYD